MYVKHGCPWGQQSQIMAKISKSYILTPPYHQGHVISEKCEEPIDELTVQVWLLYHQPNFKYCTLFVRGTELKTNGQTDKQTDRQVDDPITRCPQLTFQAGGIKNYWPQGKFHLRFIFALFAFWSEYLLIYRHTYMSLVPSQDDINM